MMRNIPKHPILESTRYLLRWTGFSLICGGIGGLLGGLFSKAIALAG